jgi:hypothetical protein
MKSVRLIALGAARRFSGMRRMLRPVITRPRLLARPFDSPRMTMEAITCPT